MLLLETRYLFLEFFAFLNSVSTYYYNNTVYL